VTYPRVFTFPKLAFSVWPFVRRPYILVYNVTQRCNLRCSYCFGKYYSDQKELTFEENKRILSDFYRLGVRRLIFTGGEPLLHKDIDDLIRFAVATGFSVGINTNGILVPHHLSSLKLLSNLNISVDGTCPEIHDTYRGKGSFDNALEGIKAAFGAGIPLNFCCTLTDANINEWPKILCLAQEYKAYVEINPLYSQFRKEENYNFPKLMAREGLREAMSKIVREKRKNKVILFSGSTYRLIQNWPHLDKDTSLYREKGHPKCLAGKKIIFMDSQGNLFPCLRVSKLVPGKSCLDLGAPEAYKQLAVAPCKSCMWSCFIEYNSLLNLSLGSLYNAIKLCL
jgi:MoaA/NifB/PqqE/SkfB family radical SAM enzyme